MLKKHKEYEFRALCDLHSARDKLIDFLSNVSSDYYMKDIPPSVPQTIIMLSSQVIIAEDNWRSIHYYGLLTHDTDCVS